MSKGIVDNKQSGIVGDVLKENITKGSKISVAAAHFTLYAFVELKKELSKIDEFRFVFTEPFAASNTSEDSTSCLYGVREEQQYKTDLNQGYVARQLVKWVKKKAQFKTIVDQKIEGGLYHVSNQNGSQVGLVGGAPFSSTGLGFTNSTNIYINNIVDDEETNKQLLKNFDAIWNNNEILKDVKKEIISKLELLYKENTPEFVYFVTLYNLFKDFLEGNRDISILQQKTGFENTEIWNKLYNFQRDGVVGAINKIETHGGCIIADSVGLGKTFEALAVIKYYELRNNRVLVLAPKKLRENWSIYRLNDKRNILAKDRFSYDLLNHTDLSRQAGYSGDINLEHINWGNYDLIVIDESHNFRNNEARNDRVTRYQRLMEEIIKAGVKTKVLMLSATPVNNKLDDLKNQIAFITEGEDAALEDSANIKSISHTVRVAQTQYNKWSNLEESDRTTERLLDLLNWDYFSLLDSLTIARSRRHIEKYYNMSEIGKFPNRLKPINKKEEIDENGSFPSMEKINNEILRLRLAVYSPMQYILAHMRKAYSEKYDTRVANGQIFKQTDRENSLIYLMKSNLLKRLESSIHSFRLTLESIIQNIDIHIQKIDYYDPNIHASNDITNIDVEDPELADALIGSKIKILPKDVDLIRWKQDLLYDKEILLKILGKTKEITPPRDKKLNLLRNMIEQKVNSPINKGNKKVLIFTAYADTAKYLYENVHQWIHENYHLHSALVTGSENPKTTLKLKKDNFNNVLTNFSPQSKEREKVMPEMDEEIDILIATDCISEGQNLQDCDYLINYDIHWNPVRIIQRFGRIDRLGSKNEDIQLVNFWPSMELDEYINLAGRVKSRMTIMDISSTGEENVITENSNEMKDLEYRRKQLEKLQNEVIDLEDVNGTISLTDFTMDDFRMDLMNYMKDNGNEIKEAPLGLFSITRNHNDKLQDEISPGVIFCLKQIDNFTESNEKNALFPYFLVYVKDNGEILYSQVQVKKILDIYRSLCFGSNEVAEDLFQLFYEETNEGKQMESYKDLLEKSVDEIVGKIEEQTTLNIFSLGSLDSLMTSSNTNLLDFEIISYLIVK
ncbi:helicase-related protein [Gracilibacillus dipsosauri]|uniref:helicase-related protein n=1 Tax=Gracilibacillus dipsosauri TaxID=178340 RepID=UPI002408F4CA